MDYGEKIVHCPSSSPEIYFWTDPIVFLASTLTLDFEAWLLHKYSHRRDNMHASFKTPHVQAPHIAFEKSPVCAYIAFFG